MFGNSRVEVLEAIQMLCLSKFHLENIDFFYDSEFVGRITSLVNLFSENARRSA